MKSVTAAMRWSRSWVCHSGRLLRSSASSPAFAISREAAARDLARIARLEPDCLIRLADPDFRKAARRTILLAHFSGSTRAALADLLGIDLAEDGADPALPEPCAAEPGRKRETRFAFRTWLGL